MKTEELQELIERMRHIGKDTALCEVKAASRKLPSSMSESISAFANTKGGIVILGLDESTGFKPVPEFNSVAMQDALVSALDKLTPRPRPDIDIVPFEGSSVVVAEIPPTLFNDRPCYITERGMYKGSFVRTGDGDRLMTPYEIDRMIESRRPTRWDAEPVMEASESDLDPNLMENFLQRQKSLHPRVFQFLQNEEILFNLRVLTKDCEGNVRPTVAGLMCLGKFPQKYFPSLVIRAAAYPYASNTPIESAGPLRFSDSELLMGSIPAMLADAVSFVERNTRLGARIEGAFRTDVPDYPSAAVREAVANALQHRDYSPLACASPVHLRLYTDRLIIESPGPLFGTLTVETLGKPGNTAQRNPFLSLILEATPSFDGRFVVENYGTGIPTIAAELTKAKMKPAIFLSGSTKFSVTFMRTNADNPAETPADHILQVLLDGIPHSASEISLATGIKITTVRAVLRKLARENSVQKTEKGNSPKQKYLLIKHS